MSTFLKLANGRYVNLDMVRLVKIDPYNDGKLSLVGLLFDGYDVYEYFNDEDAERIKAWFAAHAVDTYTS